MIHNCGFPIIFLIVYSHTTRYFTWPGCKASVTTLSRLGFDHIQNRNNRIMRINHTYIVRTIVTITSLHPNSYNLFPRSLWELDAAGSNPVARTKTHLFSEGNRWVFLLKSSFFRMGESFDHMFDHIWKIRYSL